MLAGCAAQNAEPQPPEIAYGQDICDECGMIISQANFAAALILENGDTRKFDDPGEMFIYASKHPDEVVKAWFVHDHGTEKWVNGEAASYLISPTLQSSPMGTGMIAFENKSDAEKLAAGLGLEVLDFDAVSKAMQNKGK